MNLYSEEDVLRMLRSFHTSEINVQLSMAKLSPINMETKQTAVEWLIEQIKSKADNLPTNTKENRMAKGIYVDCLIMARQAKAMEKEQIINALGVGCQIKPKGLIGYYEMGEQYYEETYKK